MERFCLIKHAIKIDVVTVTYHCSATQIQLVFISSQNLYFSWATGRSYKTSKRPLCDKNS